MFKGQAVNKQKGAIILAGGDSKRLGSPKALLDFQGKTLIELVVHKLRQNFNQITLVTDRPDFFVNLQVKLVGDLLTYGKKNPLRGIHAGLSSSSLPYQFVIACDMPFLNLDLIKYMEGLAAGYDVVVPRIDDYYQPLFAFYNKSSIPHIEDLLQDENAKIIDFYARLKVRYVGFKEITQFDSEQESFVNINTKKDYEQAKIKLAGRNDL